MTIIGKKTGMEFKEIINGKIWLFPDNVDTDAISPSQYINDLDATLKHTCETIIREFPTEVKEGDIIVAGRNFGCGSSRETAPTILQEKGIIAVIAESFARIFYRSSIARGLPIIEVENISKQFQTGDNIELNIPKAEIKNLNTGEIFNGKKIHPLLLEILKKNGLIEILLAELREETK
ncbi:MAG: LeuD/DmdB family oxidoreductase small subunit [Candidatus Hodarchaeales archaeon]|jgi:3-isopropylmalate/(R)-2-methylmalate dehydratase small subunit